LTEDLEGAEELTLFAVTARYPGENEVVTREDCGWAIDLTAKVRDKIRKSLDQKGLILSSDSE
jgi:hypothetical protein